MEFPKIHLILGAELHIHYVKETEAYHCHIFFNTQICKQTIKDINGILDALYTKKQVKKDDASIPTLNEVINAFDDYEFVLLPHGGQSHATFDKAIPAGTRFDTMMERSIYYNQFDGFTARSERGLDETLKYFQRLGINEFINLVTCSDNYDPEKYPDAKSDVAAPLTSTWMYAAPTFEGFRLSLSEKSRLSYQNEKPSEWTEYIESVKYKNERLDIDVRFSSGLNVIIGGSSSGKTLLVDSIFWKTNPSKNFEDSDYKEFGVENINIVNPSNMVPHYLGQNYIMEVVNHNNDQDIQNIEIIKNIFPSDKKELDKVNECLSELKKDIQGLIHSVRDIEQVENSLRKIPQVGRLLVYTNVKKNIFQPLLPDDNIRKPLDYSEDDYNNQINTLERIRSFVNDNPLLSSLDKEIEKIKEELNKGFLYSNLEHNIYKEIHDAWEEYNSKLIDNDLENQTKSQKFDTLLLEIANYVKLNKDFNDYLSRIADFNFQATSNNIQSGEHVLFINNLFKLDKDKVLEVFNKFLKSTNKIENFNSMAPSDLFEEKFSKKSPKVADYEEFINRTYNEFLESNKTEYKILANGKTEFEKLSAGWKTSVLLDLILGYKGDLAPIIIDQPEDNLATKYINEGLVNAIKDMKHQKQIILVSHNATIPMMGDAQTIVYCQNKDNKIYIRSALLEGTIDGESVLDIIAKITDGGKSSIKKRVKKYNLKKFN